MRRIQGKLPVALGLLATALASGCGWVDSAGGGGGDGSAGSDITLDEQPLGGAVEMLELTTPRIVVGERTVVNPLAYRFEDVPADEGVLDACLALDGFDPERAASTLSDACSLDADSCEFVAEPDTTDANVLAFNLTVPQLRAPVGRQHTLVTGREIVGEDGETSFVEESRRDINFCLIAINEAPDARDDTYVLVDGGVLEVDAAGGVLANDSDDDDVGNEPLSVASTPVVAPASAASFELREDGGFTYEFGGDVLTADVLDRFSYRVDDGTLASTAQVTVRVVASNQAPVLLAEPEAVLATVGEEVEEDFSVLFEDPEGLRLQFRFDNDLPDDGSLVLSEEGVLAGVPGPGDEGEFEMILIADDGEQTAEVLIDLVIAAAPNSAPVFIADTVFDQTIERGETIAEVEPEFFDPDGDPLSFESVGTTLPPGITLDPDTGIVSGTPTFRVNRGGIVIEASDPEGNTAQSDPFRIRVL